MKAQFVVTFDGFPEKHADTLEAMLRADIAKYPERMEMTSAKVEPVAKTKVGRLKPIGTRSNA